MAHGSWLLAWALCAAVSAQETHIPLHDGWTFQQVGKERWYPAEVPGVVHTDLLRNGLIPDPYKGSNVDSVQWIENEDWVYKCTIDADAALLKNGHMDLVFKGLDTFAEVYLNDSLLGKADNMFRSWEWSIKEKLRPGFNALKVIFRSPIKEGAKLRDAYGIQLPHDNDPSGVSPYIRKAAYQFGWDFCPRLVTCGIWQPVELRCWNVARITSFDIVSQPEGDSLYLFLRAYTSELPLVKGMVRFRLDEQLLTETIIGNVDGAGFSGYDTTMALSDRWWPRGAGPRPLHTFTAELLDEQGQPIARVSKKSGFRTVELDESDSGRGRAFTFKVNGRPMFMKGCNVVPPAMFLAKDEDRAWVDLVRHMSSAHINIARIWAGGVYPPEAFFDACDTAGILVWQDFMIANMIPGTGEFLNNVSDEANEQTVRLWHHPSLAMLCGDNELDVAWKNWGWQETYRLHHTDSIRITKANDEVHRRLGVAAKYIGRAFSPTSPLSNWGNTEGLRNGDLHYWGVWHGDSAFSSFKNNVGRFVSEYGFQSYPDSVLLSHYLDPKELYLGSPALKRLQRSYKTDRPIWEAIERELGEKPTTFGRFAEASQEVQAKAYRLAAEAHIKAQPHCMGTLFWQLNDCWPGPSWSLIDFEGHWKPGMYAIQEVYGR